MTKRYCSNAVNHNGSDFHSSKVGFYSNEKINAYESRNSERVTFIDLFAGIGGFHQSLHSLGAKCVFASEIDKNARITYEHNYKDISPNLFENDYKLFNSDITKQNLSEIPDFDILCAGFPCQPFSIAGKRKGFDDTRGTLFFNIASIVKEKVQNAKAPSVLFLENVKGLKNHDKGETLKVILETLSELGYSYRYEVLNAKNFGVPQNRERLFIIAWYNKTIHIKDFKFPYGLRPDGTHIYDPQKVQELKIQRETNQELCQKLEEARKSVEYYKGKCEDYENKQELNASSQEIADIISHYPSTQIYYDMVSRELGCKVKEITHLSVHPDWKETDEEGWQYNSFFPKDSTLEVTMIYNNYFTSDFCIGTIVRIVYNGKTFIAERNNSPWIIYANPKNV